MKSTKSKKNKFNSKISFYKSISHHFFYFLPSFPSSLSSLSFLSSSFLICNLLHYSSPLRRNTVEAIHFRKFFGNSFAGSNHP